MATPQGNPKIATYASVGGNARRDAMSPERRVWSSQVANASRWYSLKGDHVARVEAHLRNLATIAGRAMLREDDQTLIRVHAAMAPYERMLMWLDHGMKGAIPIEADDTGKEAAQKLEQAEKQWEGVKNAEQVSGIDEKGS